MLNKRANTSEPAVLSEGQRHAKIRFFVTIVLLTILLFLSVVLSVCTGIAGGSIQTLIETILNPERASDVGKVMINMRMPRALAACLTGVAFSLSGAITQELTRNPLADAGLLGINAGAGFFVAASVVLFPAAPSIVTILAAFTGAAFAVVLVYGVGISKYKTESFRLILAGAAISALLTALSQAISLVFGIAKSISFWTAGSLSGITWKNLGLTAPFIISAVVIGLFLSDYLAAMILGEESAASLGVNVRAIKLIAIFIVLLLAGSSVSLVGGISFLGLIVPHISQFLVGGDYRRMMVVSALLGGVVLVLSDIVARIVNAPFDTPVGVLVSIIAVPIFLALTYRKERKNI